MTSEEKQLLLKDLCARLSYFENWVQYEGKDYIVTGYGHGRVSLLSSLFSSACGPCPLIDEVKPYLRPMSSMTEEERMELSRLTDDKFKFYLYTREPEIICYEKYNYLEGIKVLDWLNAHHFDYRIDPSTGKTLIESGLALEAPKDMYKTE